MHSGCSSVVLFILLLPVILLFPCPEGLRDNLYMFISKNKKKNGGISRTHTLITRLSQRILQNPTEPITCSLGIVVLVLILFCLINLHSLHNTTCLFRELNIKEKRKRLIRFTGVSNTQVPQSWKVQYLYCFHRFLFIIQHV